MKMESAAPRRSAASSSRPELASMLAMPMKAADETVAVTGARRDVHCTQVRLQRRLFIPEKVVAPGKSCLRDADGLLVADGRPDLYCFFEYGNRLHRVEFGQVQSEHGECRRETRRVGELPRFGDAFPTAEARGALAGGGDGSGRDG